MSRNPGNTGRHGYKLSKITSIGVQNGKVLVALACGHTQLWEPYEGMTAEQWAAYIQQDERPLVVGKTRLRCEETHEEA